LVMIIILKMQYMFLKLFTKVWKYSASPNSWHLTNSLPFTLNWAA
jgi:hypothetical protein